jgi:hypothetical protein
MYNCIKTFLVSAFLLAVMEARAPPLWFAVIGTLLRVLD